MPDTDTSGDGTPDDVQASPPTAEEKTASESLQPAQAPAPEPAADEDAQDAPSTPQDTDQAESPVTQEPADAEPGQCNPKQPQDPTVVVRYGLMRHIGEFKHSLDPTPTSGTQVVVRTDRGVELGEVLTPVCETPCGPKSLTPTQLKDFVKKNGPDFPFRRGGKVLRLANHQDMIDHRHLNSSGREEAVFCRDKIRELKLSMKMVSVEHLLGGGRIVFYFASEGRVDFRELVRALASQYHTRIEMRQVGARDEARLVADYERCGQRCCCQQFIKDLRPVAMRMAKTQKATLDPSKISGRCGRLMCCLRYEDETYVQLRKTLPKRNTWVRTEACIGKVIDTQTITQLVRLALQDGSTKTVGMEEILEKSITPPAPQQPPANSRDQRAAARGASDTADAKQRRPSDSSNGQNQQQSAGSADADKADSPSGESSPRRPKRRRGDKRRRESAESAASKNGETVTGGTTDSPDASSQTNDAAVVATGAPGAGDQGQGEAPPKKKRRRRGRRNRSKKSDPKSE